MAHLSLLSPSSCEHTCDAFRREVPRIGFGTAGLGHSSEEAVRLALMAGYRHIDTAQVGWTERGMGRFGFCPPLPVSVPSLNGSRALSRIHLTIG